MSLNTTHPRTSRTRNVLIGILAIILVLSVAVVYALFSQTLPVVTVPTQPLLVQGCASLHEGPVTPGSGVVLFDCSGSPAFTASNGPFTATPSWPAIPTTPSTGVTVSLDITTTGSCIGSLQQLINNTQIQLQNSGYDYCLGYSGVPSSGGSIGPVTINWAIP